jgi:hypothetical protein
MIVTGGGISPDGSCWIPSRPDYLVPVEVLSALFRGRMLGLLIDAHAEGRRQFFGDCKHLADSSAFRAYLGPLWKMDWFVYAKRPFAGPEQVLAYLSRYTHRVAISNSRLLSADASGVTFKYKDYRIEGPERYKTQRRRHPRREARPCSPTHRYRSECRSTTPRRSARNLRCDNPSLPALRQPHGDHRDVRGTADTSASSRSFAIVVPPILRSYVVKRRFCTVALHDADVGDGSNVWSRVSVAPTVSRTPRTPGRVPQALW